MIIDSQSYEISKITDNYNPDIYLIHYFMKFNIQLLTYQKFWKGNY